MILSYLRTVILYGILIAVIRIMGKRQIGEMEPTEFVVTMLVANLAAIPMQDGGIPLYSGLVPILTVLGGELVLSALSLKSIKFRRFLCGKPVILIENGKILQDNLRQTRITLDELIGQLRVKNILELQNVQFAILETNGKLSVFPYPTRKPPTVADMGLSVKEQFLPVTVIEDGFLFTENLPMAGKDALWVTRFLDAQKSTVSDTFLLTVDCRGKTHWIGKEAKA